MAADVRARLTRLAAFPADAHVVWAHDLLDRLAETEVFPAGKARGGYAPSRATYAPRCRHAVTNRGDRARSHGRCVDSDLVRWVANPRAFRADDPSVDGCAEAVIQYCRRKRWTPVASQSYAWDAAVGLGARLDLVLWDPRTQRVVVVEVKATTERSPRLNAEYEAPRTGRKARDQFQALIQQRLLEACTGLRGTTTGVLRVGYDFAARRYEVDAYPVTRASGDRAWPRLAFVARKVFREM